MKMTAGRLAKNLRETGKIAKNFRETVIVYETHLQYGGFRVWIPHQTESSLSLSEV